MVTTTTQLTDRNEQRLKIQKLFDLKIVVRRGENEEINASPLDISYNGIKLLTSQSLAFAELVVLHFKSSALNIDFEMDANVRWIRQGDDQTTWLIGCSFVNKVTDDYVDAIATAGGVDRRQSPRCENQIHATVKLAGKSNPFRVMLLDYSASGIRFASFEAVEPNQPIKLALTDNEGDLLQVGAISQWNMSYDSGFLIGCEVVGEHRNLFETWQQGLQSNKPRPSGGSWRLGAYSCLLMASVLVLFWLLAN